MQVLTLERCIFHFISLSFIHILYHLWIILTMTSKSILSRQIIISSHNEGPAVNLVSWIGLSTMILSVGARLGSKFLVVRRWSTDDTLIIVAMLFGICHSVFLSMMVSNGLGRDQDTLNRMELENYQKYAYASQLVYIPTLCFAKLSTLFYLRALTPDSNYAIFNRLTEICVILWALSAEFSILFQCNMPNPWAVLSTGKCFNIGAFWKATGVLDIATDCGIILLPIFLVWGLQMQLRRKVLVFIAFGTRMFILPLSIVRLVVISSSGSPTLSNQTLVSYRNYLWTSVQLNSAIFFACLSFLKPFMESMSSGGLAASVNPMDSSYSNKQSPFNSKSSNFISSISGWKASKKNSSRPPQELRTISTFQDYDEDDEVSTPTTTSPNSNLKRSSPIFNIRFNNTNAIGKLSHEGEELGTLRPDGAMTFAHIRRSTPDDAAERSTIGSDKMIIRRTTEWDVREDFESVR